ncbi:MAG: hypothetical protein QOI42_370 [Frankiaceae bacterium]|nr:hypothetical protein [Frankiaceae bacterium]
MRPRLRAFLTTCAVLTVMTAAVPTSAHAAASPTDGGAVLVALGDSFASGEGSAPYLAGTDTAGNTCHRSPQAYGSLLASILGVSSSFAFVACSGAVTADLFAPNHGGNRLPGGAVEPAQLCQAATVTVAGVTVPACPAGTAPALGPATRAVTLSIGGNDAGFSAVVGSCVFVAYLEIGQPGRGCASRPDITLPAFARLMELAGLSPSPAQPAPAGTAVHAISDVLAAVHALAPNAHIYLTGYPKLFGDAGSGDCTVGTVTDAGSGTTLPIRIAASDAAFLDNATEFLDNVEAQAVAPDYPWASFVSVQARFAGHGICSADTWLTPLRVTSTNGALSVAQDSLHPTPVGQWNYVGAIFDVTRGPGAL